MSQVYRRRCMIPCGRIIRFLADGVELCTLRRGHEGECLRPEFSEEPGERYRGESAWTKKVKLHGTKFFVPYRPVNSLMLRRGELGRSGRS